MLAVLHVVASINRNVGGPAASVPGLAMALADCGVRTSVASLDYQEHGKQTRVRGVTNVTVVPRTIGKRLRGWSPSFGAALADAASKGVDVIHHHGLWMVPGIYARRTASRFGVPLVISPRGMLDPWSLERGPVRKRIASLVYERRNLRAARVLHATSDMEARAIRDYGLTQPIAVIPNGVDLPEDSNMTTPDALQTRFPELENRRCLLYMGRLHPKKGLDLLLDAWRTLAPDFPAWHLVIAGPDLIGYGAELQTTVAGDPALRRSITFAGMLDGLAKRAALAHAQLFVLPTRAENFGIAVAEALAHRIPVVTTTAAPWSDLATHECGWWVAPESKAVSGALRSAMERSPAELRAMGERGRAYASTHLAWSAIATRMLDVYRWIVAGGPKPPCVRET